MHHIDVRMEKDVYDVNNTIADGNARHLKEHGVRAFDLLGAIGSGKTALIERLVPLLAAKGLRPARSPATCMVTTISSGSSRRVSLPTTQTPARNATSTHIS